MGSEHAKTRDLLGPYLLGTLEPDETREVEEHLEACEGCREEARGLRLAHERLADLASISEQPPPDLKNQVVTGMPSRSRRRAPLFAVAAAALCVLAALGALYWGGIFGREPVASATLEPTELAPRAGGELRVSEDDPNARAKLEVWGMPRPGENEYYELWFGEEGGRVSAGTFTVDAEGRGTLYMTVPEEASGYGRVGITLEEFPEEPSMRSARVVLGGKLEDS